MTGPGESDDLLDVPPLGAGWIPLGLSVALLAVGLVWGGMQVVVAAQGDGCSPVRDPFVITQRMGRLDPRDAGKPVALTLLPDLINAREVDDPHFSGVHYVAGYVQFPGEALAGPGLWEVRDAHRPPFNGDTQQVIARNPSARELSPGTASASGDAHRAPELDQVMRCVATHHR